MIKNEKEYSRAMRAMIVRVQSAEDADEINCAQMTMEEREILFDCITDGYVRGKTTDVIGKDRHMINLRMMDGSARPEVYNTIITLKGLCFLKPDRIKAKANIAIFVSACALLVSILANLDKIASNLQMLKGLIG